MTTINKEEIQKFSKLADEWWDVNGKFKPLHMFNPIRIEYILDEISKHYTNRLGNAFEVGFFKLFLQFAIEPEGSKDLLDVCEQVVSEADKS